MKCLSFSRTGVTIGGRRVRAAAFEERSMFPTSAACVVANGVREHLARALGAETALRLFEPVIPSPQAWAAIALDAACFRLRGPLCDAAIVLRSMDAVALASAAFGERESDARPLSEIEHRVLERSLATIAGAFAPVCGFRGQAPLPEPLTSVASFTTYFELQLDQPVKARIGVALSREPADGPGACIVLEDLLDVEIELTATLHGRTLPAGTLARLEPGEIVPITDGTALTGTVVLAGAVIARGECGIRSGRYAVAVNES